MLKDSDKSIVAGNIAEKLHEIFLNSMEARYKEILSFLGFLLPAISGFLLLLHKFEVAGSQEKPLVTFLIGTISIMSILFWGATYALAMSYRYRYLQASVYKIEEAFDASFYIPTSFKPSPITGYSKRMSISVAPGIMQVHIFFFMFSMAAIGIAYLYISPYDFGSVIVSLVIIFYIALIFFVGGYIYPNKLNNIIKNLKNNKKSKIVFITGPSGAGKSTMREACCKFLKLQETPAVTTRINRPEEEEIHITLSDRIFESLYNSNALCLVAENHGSKYGYLKSFIDNTNSNLLLFEVDSKTAISEKDKLGATIVRVVPGDKEKAKEIIRQKRDGINDRLADFDKQCTEPFLSERKRIGDIIVVNNYDQDSINSFIKIIEKNIGH